MSTIPASFETETQDAYRSPADGFSSHLTVFGPSKGERLAAAVAHGGTLFAWFLAPLLVYLVKRGESKYVEFQAMQALLWSLGGTVISLVTCGLAIPVFLVWHIVAAARVLDESTSTYEYPIVGQMARAIVDA